jgi:glycerate 2-kinase
MHILIAPNAFKNSLDAADVARAIGLGLDQSKLSCTYRCFPVGDGGDGTARLLASTLDAKAVSTEVQDPLGRKIQASFWLAEEGKTAIIELAEASGLRLLASKEYDPLKASTFGTGELIAAALDQQVNRVVIAVGGSATVDGASGALAALGVKFLNRKNKPMPNRPSELSHLGQIDCSGLDPRIANVEFNVLCDVNNPLLGPLGAATVYGPQKGASPGQVLALEKGLSQFRDISQAATGQDMASIPRGGAAGGTAAGLSVFLGAKLLSGIDYFLDATGFELALSKADLVITGEGSIDEQTLQGKAPFGVASRAKQKGKPVIGLGGSVPLHPSTGLRAYFDVLMSIVPGPVDLVQAQAQCQDNLLRSAREVGNLLAISKKAR